MNAHETEKHAREQDSFGFQAHFLLKFALRPLAWLTKVCKLRMKVSTNELGILS